MIDRDSYSAGFRGYDEFMGDARAFLAMVRSFSEFDARLDQTMAAYDMQLLIDSARRMMAATAVDELAAIADLLADTAREFGAEIEDDLRAARRLLDMTLAETNGGRRTALKPVETLLFDPEQIPEFCSWRTDKFGR
jgi:hypothetical protein